MIKFSSTIIITVFIFVLNFNTNHYQIGYARVSRQTPSSCFIVPQNGTTRQLKEIFTGRCYYFINILQKENCDFDSKKYDCDLIWNTFYNSSLKNTQNISDYEPLLKLTDHSIPENRSLFWSGTYTPAHQYTKTHQYWSLEDTFTGFLLDELVFCIGKQGFDYNNTQCNRDQQFFTFWNAASTRFAEKASGSILVVLNGSRSSGAVSNTSTFYTKELPNFKSVKKLTVLLLHNPNSIKVETCEKGRTLENLKSILKNKSIEYECVDNPKDILFFMCFQDPLSKECQSIKFSIDGSVNLIANKFSVLSLAFILTILNLLLL